MQAKNQTHTYSNSYNYNCNNCGKKGHNFHQCKLPITSYGIIAYRNNPASGQKEYLMICRKHTLGFMDFMRGKYSINNKYYIFNMIKQMTVKERTMLLNDDFDVLWKYAWNIETNVKQPEMDSESEKEKEKDTNVFFSNPEKISSRDKFNSLREGVFIQKSKANTETQENMSFSLESLIKEASTQLYEEPEWGFPKGRREINETDLDCALREFYEETGYKDEVLPPGLNARKHSQIIENVAPFEETFMGSNYKTYRHRYYLMNMDYDYSQQWSPTITNETSAICWMPFLQALNSIRQYNLEKRKLLICVNSLLLKYKVK